MLLILIKCILIWFPISVIPLKSFCANTQHLSPNHLSLYPRRCLHSSNFCRTILLLCLHTLHHLPLHLQTTAVRDDYISLFGGVYFIYYHYRKDHEEIFFRGVDINLNVNLDSHIAKNSKTVLLSDSGKLVLINLFSSFWIFNSHTPLPCFFLSNLLSCFLCRLFTNYP